MPLATPSTGLEELVDVNSGKEIVATHPVVDQFAVLRGKYEPFLDFGDRREWLKNKIQEVLLPPNINLFLQQTREYEDHPNYQSFTGLFISQLIQNSYNAGNNNFELDVNTLKPVDNLAREVSGTKERMVRVVIKGEVGDLCGYQAQHVTFTIEKAGDWCGNSVRHSTFTIKEAGKYCGQYSQHSTFTIEEAGNGCGFAAKNSTFKTHDSLQYERFKKSVSQDRSNELYLLAVDGSILNGGKW